MRGGAAPYRGPVSIAYRPDDDRQPDPGEVAWCWVPYEDAPKVGKDRPVVVLGTVPGGRLAVAMLSSRDRSHDPAWVRVGAGGWDADRRTSYARIDRMFAVPAASIRRAGAALQRDAFDDVVRGLHLRRSRRGLLARLGRLIRRPAR